jgi:hypothetical protein
MELSICLAINLTICGCFNYISVRVSFFVKLSPWQKERNGQKKKEEMKEKRKKRMFLRSRAQYCYYGSNITLEHNPVPFAP